MTEFVQAVYLTTQLIQTVKEIFNGSGEGKFFHLMRVNIFKLNKNLVKKKIFKNKEPNNMISVLNKKLKTIVKKFIKKFTILQVK